MTDSKEIVNKSFRLGGRDNDAAAAESEHNCSIRIGNKSAIPAKKPVVIPAAEGKQATVTERPYAPTHSSRLDLRRAQIGQRQSSGPQEAMNKKLIGSYAVTSNHEEHATEDDRKWKNRQP